MNSLYPITRETGKYKGSVYSVARDVTTAVMYINKAMFEDAGVPIPSKDWTVEEFIEVAKQLTKVDDDGKQIQWGYYFPKYADGLYSWLIGHGGSFTNEDASKCMLDTPESKEGLQFMYDLIHKHKVVPSESQAKQYGRSAFAPIVASKVAMTIGGLSASNNFNNANPPVEYVVLPIPKVKGRSFTHSFVNTWTMPRGAKNPELSWRVMEFLSSKEGQQIVLDTNMGLPASMDVDITDFVNKRPDNKVFIDALEYTVPFETFLNGAEFYKILRDEGERLWLDEATVDEAVDNIITKTSDLFQ
jgi:multiple sugar transport system substrate-binding protein